MEYGEGAKLLDTFFTNPLCVASAEELGRELRSFAGGVDAKGLLRQGADTLTGFANGLAPELTSRYGAGAVCLGMAALFWIARRYFPFSVYLLYNSVCGAVTLYLLNMVGGQFGIGVQITPLNALIAGIFGLPGVIVMLLRQFMS